MDRQVRVVTEGDTAWCIVVMMTGNAVESLIEQALSEGAKTCLSKPVSIEEILEIVEEVVPASGMS